MDDLTKKHLQDILTAIEEIESFFGSEPKLYDDFYSNLCLRRAVETVSYTHLDVYKRQF